MLGPGCVKIERRENTRGEKREDEHQAEDDPRHDLHARLPAALNQTVPGGVYVVDWL